jgi:hypothetical protein
MTLLTQVPQALPGTINLLALAIAELIQYLWKGWKQTIFHPLPNFQAWTRKATF